MATGNPTGNPALATTLASTEHVDTIMLQDGKVVVTVTIDFDELPRRRPFDEWPLPLPQGPAVLADSIRRVFSGGHGGAVEAQNPSHRWEALKGSWRRVDATETRDLAHLDGFGAPELASFATDVIHLLCSGPFRDEFASVVQSYGTFLRRDVTMGHDRKLKEALTRVRLQDQILDGVSMADPDQACTMLGLSQANPSQSLKRRERQLMKFMISGRPKYPLFQFDIDNRRVHPAFVEILRAAEERKWSNFRLLNWMMRPHQDFSGTPADALADDGQAVQAAFLREIEAEVHG